MPAHRVAAVAAELCLGIGVALLVYALLQASLRKLLDRLMGIPEGTIFYLRALALILLSVALSKAVVGTALQPGAHFIEYVWAVASGLSDVFQNFFVALLVYLGLVTVLIAVLRPKNER